MNSPKVDDELTVRCGRERVLRKGVVRPAHERPALSEAGEETFMLTDEFIVVLGDVVHEEHVDDPMPMVGEPVLNTDYSVVYMPRINVHKKKSKRRRKRR